MNDRLIILFDGDCALCHRAVRFVLARDAAGRFRFAPLRSTAAQHLLAPAGLDPATMRSVVLLADGIAHLKSEAALGICAALPQPWCWLAGLRIVPRRLRDWLYEVVARNRLRWFGRAETCAIPSPDFSARLVQ